MPVRRIFRTNKYILLNYNSLLLAMDLMYETSTG